jgi:diguanylate cyclase (GGDEF)-like protein
MRKQPAAFMSYVHHDDKYERLTTFRALLSDEVQIHTGEEFPIFQDRKDVQWGQNWKERLDESLDCVTFLIPIITPGFFKRQYCREELERFLERERKLKRSDLILPVYYVDCLFLSDEKLCRADPLAQAISSRQYIDWRELRFEPSTSPEVGKKLADLAIQIRDALHRIEAEEQQEQVAISDGVQPKLQPPDDVEKYEPPVTVLTEATQYQLMSLTDPLTGLLNRRYIEQRLVEEVERSHRHRFPMSLMMIDVDDFKLYNDSYGHQAGDLALEMVAQCLKQVLRSADVASRYGGEEFCILLPQTSLSEAAGVAERVRRRVESTAFPHGKTQPMGTVTVSIGVAAWSSALNTPAAIIGAADRALYIAKSRGKNSIYVHHDESL